MNDYTTVSKEDIYRRAVSIFIAAGFSEADADIIADTLMEAEVEGRESHGFMRLNSLYQRTKQDVINTKPDIKFEEVGSSLYMVNGDNALGAILAAHVMDFCAEKAKENGVCVAFVNNANHLGAAGYYTIRAAEKGTFAFIATNGGPAVAPWGGMSKLLGTNPFSCSFPAGRFRNFTLDIATSASAMGKIIMYSKEGKSIPKGWAMDIEGNDTNSAKEATDAFKQGVGILPMAGYKGTGIAIMIDVLAGILSGAKLSKDINAMFSSGISGVGYFCFVVDIEHFMKLEVFEQRVEDWFEELKNDKKRPGIEEIFIPGEIENRKIARGSDEISIFTGTMAEIEAIEAELTTA